MPLEPWKVIDSHYALEHRWLKVRRDTCLLPNGVVIDDYFWLESPEHTIVVALTPTSEAILNRQYKHAAHAILLEFPGGVIDDGETALAGAQRELLEETGYGGGVWQCLGVFHANPTKSNARTHIFLAKDVVPSATPHGDITEEIEVSLVPWSHLIQSPCFETTSSTLALYLAQARLA
jgi:ADP-ribose pyrophosphatase